MMTIAGPYVGATERRLRNRYPFIVLALIYLARSPLFDNWTLPLTLVTVYLISLAYAIYCAFALRRDAEKTRSESRERFTQHLLKLKGNRDSDAKQTLITQMEFLLREIEGLRTGAFSPFSQQPALKALMAVLSGISGITILEYFAFADL